MYAENSHLNSKQNANWTPSSLFILVHPLHPYSSYLWIFPGCLNSASGALLSVIRIDPFFSSKLFAMGNLQQRQEASVAKRVETSGRCVSAMASKWILYTLIRHGCKWHGCKDARQNSWHILAEKILEKEVSFHVSFKPYHSISIQDIFGIFWLPHHSNNDLFFVKFELHEAIPDENRAETVEELDWSQLKTICIPIKTWQEALSVRSLYAQIQLFQVRLQLLQTPSCHWKKHFEPPFRTFPYLIKRLSKHLDLRHMGH